MNSISKSPQKSQQNGAVLSEATLALVIVTLVVFLASVGLIAVFRSREARSFETMQQLGPCAVCEEGRICIKDDRELCPRPTPTPED